MTEPLVLMTADAKVLAYGGLIRAGLIAKENENGANHFKVAHVVAIAPTAV
jgi:hypothetical protein